MTTFAYLSQAPVLFAQAMGGAGLGANVAFIGIIFAIMYFVMIRPQQKQQRETQAMLSALKKGDDVITSSGILGKIFAIDEKLVTLDLGGGTKVRMLKSSIQGKVTVEPAKAADEAKKEEK